VGAALVPGGLAGLPSLEQWPEVRPEPRDADFLVGADDTVKHWIAVHREQIGTSNAVVALTDLDATRARTDIIECTCATPSST